MNKIYLYIPLVFLFGCSTLFETNKERWSHIYDDQPVVTRVPVPEENQTHYNTRNIVVDGYQANSSSWFIIMMGSIIVDYNTKDSTLAILPILRFRSIGPNVRFSENQDLQILLNERVYKYEAMDYEVSKSKGDFLEGWTVGIPKGLFQKVAYSDTIKAMIGSIPLLLDNKMLAPLRVLIDTVQIKEKVLGQPNHFKKE